MTTAPRSLRPLFMPAAIFLVLLVPRVFALDSFFIQDEQPWIDRSQLYVNSLFQGDLTEAGRYPLSNHPAITLMTTVGPVINYYASRHGLEGTYNDWSLDHKRHAAVWARTTWAVVTTIVLFILYLCLKELRIFQERPWQAAWLTAWLGFEPWIWGISRTVSVDVVMAIAVVGALVTAGVAREKKTWPWFVGSGAWWAVAFVSKSPALITLPFVLGLVTYVPLSDWRQGVRRLSWWLGGALITMVVVWPPVIAYPIARISDVLGRAELHSTTPEHYLWPGIHPPLFFFVLSTLTTIGLVLYILFRAPEWWRRSSSFYSVFDTILAAGLWHGGVLLYLQGDHARKNLPVLALLAIVGGLGWLRLLQNRKLNSPAIAVGIMAIHLALIGPYFPHLLTAYNYVFPSTAGERLLVDVGNGSRLVADYINQHETEAIYATPMDSLVQPYVTPDRRGNLRALPDEGLASLPAAITHIVVPASLPARVEFDAAARHLLADLAKQTPVTTLSVRGVPLFFVYRVP